MNEHRKTLLLFGYVELFSALLSLFGGFLGGGLTSWTGLVTSLLSAYLLLAAAEDPQKIFGAWLITLVDLVLSVAGGAMKIVGGADLTTIIGTAIAVIINFVVFNAANSIKKAIGR